MTNPDSCIKTLPRVSFESSGCGENGFSMGSGVITSSCGGFVTAVSGGTVPGWDVDPSAGAHDVTKITAMSRNILDLNLPPIIISDFDVGPVFFVPH